MIILDKPLSVIVKPPPVIIMDYPSLTNFLMAASHCQWHALTTSYSTTSVTAGLWYHARSYIKTILFASSVANGACKLIRLGFLWTEVRSVGQRRSNLIYLFKLPRESGRVKKRTEVEPWSYVRRQGRPIFVMCLRLSSGLYDSCMFQR